MAELVNSAFGHIVDVLAAVLFFRVPIIQLPFILAVMVMGGLFFTIRFGFINVRMFKHAIDVIRGKYDNPEDEGEISHFQALTSALSATVGLGNIAGVAIAVQLGGPGAVFWLWVVAFFGMSMKFSSCTLSQLYRDVGADGHVLGGPMVYLSKAFKEKLNLPRLGKGMGIFFAFATILGSLGGGNLFQANQSYELLAGQFTFLKANPWLVGFVLAALAGIVLIGGITRIADVTSKMVPAMVVFYVISCMSIIIAHSDQVGAMFSDIFTQAFSPEAVFAGGFLGVLIQGLKRGSFSNEAGVGTAAIAHAAAKTDKPVREGIVAMIGPFIDTHLICTMTALSILLTKAHLDPSVQGKGALITAQAFASLGEWMPLLLTIASVVFAFSTIISYSYYGERSTEFLFGIKAIPYYRLIFIMVTIIGPVAKVTHVVDFSDLVLLSMALPNIFGMMFLSGHVSQLTKEYLQYMKDFRAKEASAT